MLNKKPRLILGSASPRRADMLKQVGITPDLIHPADIDETPKARELPAPYCLRVALEKNAAIAEKFPDDFIITADTTLGLGRRIIGKPDDIKHAEKILRLISGRAHQICTSVVVRAPDGKVRHRTNISRVKVKRLTDEEIAAFLKTGEWDGAAGAYMFQKNFAQYIVTMSGSPSGIIGLPLYETMHLLKGLGYGTAQ